MNCIFTALQPKPSFIYMPFINEKRQTLSSAYISSEHKQWHLIQLITLSVTGIWFVRTQGTIWPPQAPPSWSSARCLGTDRWSPPRRSFAWGRRWGPSTGRADPACPAPGAWCACTAAERRSPASEDSAERQLVKPARSLVESWLSC